jgi:hypothetical protein
VPDPWIYFGYNTSDNVIHCAGAIVIVVVAVHPLASDMLKVYVPAALAKLPVPVKGPTPPPATIVTFVVVCPHAIGSAKAEATNGRVTVPVNVLLQPVASLTVKLYGPIGKLNVPVPV